MLNLHIFGRIFLSTLKIITGPGKPVIEKNTRIFGWWEKAEPEIVWTVKNQIKTFFCTEIFYWLAKAQHSKTWPPPVGGFEKMDIGKKPSNM